MASWQVWCYWTNNLVYFPNLLVYLAGISVFMAGSGYQELGESKPYVMAFSLLAILAVILANVFGLQTGRWLHNVGGISAWVTGAALLLFGVLALVRYGSANPMPVESFFADILTFDKLSFFAAICFGFAGLELAAVLAGEVKDPERTIPRATVSSGIVVAGIYILGTFALLVALPRTDINIITGFLQGIAAVADKLGVGWATSLLALLITLGGIGGLMAWFTGAARMPFVAGIDHFLPASFGRVHPKYGSPYIAVILQAIIAALFVVMSFAGATVQEAYLILLDTTLLVYFLPYVYVFAAYAVIRSRNDAEKSDFLKSRFVATLHRSGRPDDDGARHGDGARTTGRHRQRMALRSEGYRWVSSFLAGGGGSLLGGNPALHRASRSRLVITKALRKSKNQSQSRLLKKK